MSIKKKVLILCSLCMVILVGCIVVDKKKNVNYMHELKYDQVMEKVNKKESFILCISQTYCEHCNSFKPKYNNVANREKIDVYYIDVDLLSDSEKTTLKQHFSYSATPTTVFVIDGEEKTAATRIYGDASEEKILNKFKSNGFID